MHRSETPKNCELKSFTYCTSFITGKSKVNLHWPIYNRVCVTWPLTYVNTCTQCTYRTVFTLLYNLQYPCSFMLFEHTFIYTGSVNNYKLSMCSF